MIVRYLARMASQQKIWRVVSVVPNGQRQRAMRALIYPSQSAAM
jgi:hypothetical protein